MTPSGQDRAAGLVFILGFPRSGTSLLGQILANSPDAVLFEERPLLSAAIGDFADHADGPARLSAADDNMLAAYRDDFWRKARLEAAALAGKTVVEQTAFNTLYLPVIGRLFPDAAIVFAVRDPRDVVFSCFRRQFLATRLTLEFRTLESTARFYDSTVRLAQGCRESLALRISDFRNEDLIADFDGQSQRLCAFAGIAWSPEMRRFEIAARERFMTTSNARKIRRGLEGDGVGVWRRYREHMAPVLPILAPWVEKFGYPRD